METLKQIRERHAAELSAATDAIKARINIVGATPTVYHENNYTSLDIYDYDAFHAWRLDSGITLTVRPYHLTFERDGIQYRASTRGALPNVLARFKNVNARKYENRYHPLTTADILRTYHNAVNIKLYPNNDYSFELKPV